MTTLFPRSERRGTWLLPALATAGLLALAMPGRIGWWPLLFVALVPLLLVALTARPGRSALAGFVCGLVTHLALLYWILIVLGRYGGLPLFLSLPGLLLLAAYMALYPAVFCALLSLLAGRSWHRERPVAALVWLAPVLGWGSTGCVRCCSPASWMDLGYGLYAQPQLIQSADLGGHHLVTFAVVLCNSLLVGIVDRQRRDVRWNMRRERGLLLLACATLVFLVGYSTVALPDRHPLRGPCRPRWRWSRAPVKWSPAFKTATVDTYLRLSREAIGDGRRTGGLAGNRPALLPAAGPAHRPTDRLHRGRPTPGCSPARRCSPSPADRRQRAGASLQRRHPARPGRASQRPASTWCRSASTCPCGPTCFEPLVVSVGDRRRHLERAAGARPMRLGLLICYESIFPDIARRSVSREANLLVNLTNDAWYGRSSAPHQSLAMAVFRAVENKRSLVRAANTGISGFVDPVGRIVGRTGLFVEAALVSRVPLLDGQTVFNRQGHLFGPACAALIPLCLLLGGRRR